MFSQSAGYAVRAMILLAGGEQFVGGRQIARQLRVPAMYLSKILRQLCREGLLVSRKGWGGGFKLALDPRKIPLQRIIGRFEQASATQGCVLGLRSCGRKKPCPLHANWGRVKGLYAQMTRQVTLSHMI